MYAGVRGLSIDAA